MPQANGKIWADVVNGVKRGISTADVSLCIGENSLDETTLCLSSKINKAALFCPRYIMAPGIDLMENGAFSKTALDHIKSQISQIRSGYTVGPYGVCVPDMQLNNFASGNSTSYTRVFDCARQSWYIARPNAPTGNQTVAQTSFKAINHFDGYDHTVKITPPVTTVTVAAQPNGDKLITVVFSVPPTDGKTLSISNLFLPEGTKKYYFGVIVFRGTNADGWLTSDVVHVSTSNVAIAESTNTIGYTVSVYDDATNDNGYYRIIPFVTDKANVQSVAGGSVSQAFSNSVAYGIRIDDSCGSVFTVRVGGSTGGGSDVQNYIFTWKEGNNGAYYPVPGNNSYTYTLGTNGPGIAIYFSESSWYLQLKAASLAAALKQVDMVMPYTDEKGIRHEPVFTWYADTSKTSTLFRDTRYTDKDKLFFYIKPEKSTPILNAGLADIIGRFHWIDGSVDELFSTYIPDIAGV